MNFLGLPWYFWAALMIIVIVFRLTIRRGIHRLRNLRAESRPLNKKEQQALSDSPFYDEFRSTRAPHSGSPTENNSREITDNTKSKRH